ncbi:hypothetical protein [Flavobacterium sp. 140616W15]|uniref:hypothetical protein n=1 Tax=Flavobacterium sp. 140616W15 TaxID=2478552 RepID=UPI0013EB2907|nr:hypothetical protein [Flavobacterium sp. 140616W15]
MLKVQIETGHLHDFEYYSLFTFCKTMQSNDFMQVFIDYNIPLSDLDNIKL